MQGNKFDDQLVMNTGSPIMKNTMPGGIHTNIGGKNYDQNFKSDMLTSVNFTQLASTGLQNTLSRGKQEMGQLSKQWSQQAQKVHELSNSLQNNTADNSSLGSEDARSLQHAQTLASSISSGIGFFKIIKADGSIISFNNDALNHNLNEYQKYAHELSRSSNQQIRDAFTNTNSLTTNSTKTISDTVATSQALNDIQSNQSTISSNFSNDFTDYLHSRGLSATDMTVSEQNAAAQPFVRQKINDRYGIKTDLPAVSTNHSNIESLANQARSNINSNNINLPALDDLANRRK